MKAKKISFCAGMAKNGWFSWQTLAAKKRKKRKIGMLFMPCNMP